MKPKVEVVVCDDCGRVLKFQIDPKTKQYVKDILEELGWVEAKDGTWRCPYCC